MQPQKTIDACRAILTSPLLSATDKVEASCFILGVQGGATGTASQPVRSALVAERIDPGGLMPIGAPTKATAAKPAGKRGRPVGSTAAKKRTKTATENTVKLEAKQRQVLAALAQYGQPGTPQAQIKIQGIRPQDIGRICRGLEKKGLATCLETEGNFSWFQTAAAPALLAA